MLFVNLMRHPYVSGERDLNEISYLRSGIVLFMVTLQMTSTSGAHMRKRIFKDALSCFTLPIFGNFAENRQSVFFERPRPVKV